jgi:hypothetical protein
MIEHLPPATAVANTVFDEFASSTSWRILDSYTPQYIRICNQTPVNRLLIRGSGLILANVLEDETSTTK